MKAMLFAAGKGTRLKPLTNHHPKCLVEAGGKTLLEHNILWLKHYGVQEIIVNTHHLGDQVIAFLDTHDFGLPIHTSPEIDLLETGGGLLQAREHFQNESAFVVCNSDIFTDLDLTSMIRQHKTSGSLATLAVAPRETSRYLRFDTEGLLCGWENQKSGEVISWNDHSFERQAFHGIQIMSPGIFDHMTERGPAFSTIPVYLAAAQAGEAIRGFPMESAYWIDIGTIEKLEELRNHLSKPGFKTRLG